MSVSKFTFEIRKYIVIDKTNLKKETNFSKSPTNIAINYSARRVISIQYSILEVGRKLKYRTCILLWHRRRLMQVMMADTNYQLFRIVISVL